MNCRRRMLMRHLLQHPVQTGLSVLGIALAVAIVLSIDLTNASARRAFDLAKLSIFGTVSHQITADNGGVDEELYRQLRREHGLQRLTPIVSGYVQTLDGGMLEVIGIDPVAMLGTGGRAGGLRVQGIDSPMALLIEPGAVLISEAAADKLDLTVPGNISVSHFGKQHRLQVIGVLPAHSALQQEVLQSSVLADIATAQEILAMQGQLSRIDLVLDDKQEAQLQQLIRYPLELLPSTARGNAMQQMTRAFRINLTALSLLALVIGAFLIYNTMTLSVLKRRDVIATLRTMGLQENELFRLVLGEALILGIAGTLVGTGLGMLLSQHLLKLASRTMNDLYFMGQVQTLYLNHWSLLKATGLGLFTSLVAAYLPAREAARIPPVITRLRSRLEAETRYRHRTFTIAGLLLCVLAMIVLAATGRSISGGFAALFFLILGFALFAPGLLVLLINLARPLLSSGFGLMGNIAARGLLASLSRTQVAVTALMIAISATIGVSIMISSFRGSVQQWLEGYLAADIYITQARNNPSGIDETVIERIRQHPDVDHVYGAGWHRFWQDESLTWLYVTGIPREAFNAYQFADNDAADRWQRFVTTDSVIISEPYAYHNNVARGDRIILPAADGERIFTILGIYRDYSSDRGVVTMHEGIYAGYWDAAPMTSLMITLQAGADAGQTAAAFNDGILNEAGLRARSNRSLRNQSLEIFDRTFAITEVLRLLTIIIATTGILGALMAIQLERGREFAVLRANGLTPRDLKKLVLTESGLMGTVAGILAIPLGVVMAAVLIFVINRRSFGWSMELMLEPRYLLSALAIGLLAGVLAGVYPAWHMAGTSPALALRDE
jgi:putative ABC transport system permease protein